MDRRDDTDLRGLPAGELVKELADEVSGLVKAEIELARTELTEKGKRAGIGLGELGAAGIVALYALGALTACFIAALAALGLQVWLAALIVAVIYAIIAAVLYFIGRQQLEKGIPPTPERTQKTIKEDIEWAKTRTPSREK
jgi:Putative Actinobacterial Holin-X, holin superfamily III